MNIEIQEDYSEMSGPFYITSKKKEGLSMEINAVAAIGILGTISSITFACIGYRNGLKKESSDSGKSSGTLMPDVGYIKSRC